MKRYLGISPWRYGGWRTAPNALTPEQVEAAKTAPVKGRTDMTEECNDGLHRECGERTIDGFDCGCWCHAMGDDHAH